MYLLTCDIFLGIPPGALTRNPPTKSQWTNGLTPQVLPGAVCNMASHNLLVILVIKNYPLFPQIHKHQHWGSHRPASDPEWTTCQHYRTPTARTV